MKKMVSALIILSAFFIICPALGQADIVYIHNGDKLFGTIQNPSFSLQTPYGIIEIKNEFLKSITVKNRSAGVWFIESINNDRFSGTWLNPGIRFIQDNGERKEIKLDTLQQIRRETQGPSYPILTTIITMKNNDRFSGKILTPGFEIRANHISKTVQSNSINRIEFINNDRADTEILLENGDLITGNLQLNQFRLAPDAVSEFAATKSSLKSIQFNAPKMVLKEFSNSRRAEKDGDEDGIPDFADICPDTPRGDTVSQDGCSKGATLATAAETMESERVLNNGDSHRENSPNPIENILFDFDRYELKPRYCSALDEFVDMLTQNRNVQVDIQGYTDNIGTAEYNQHLSEARARSVRNYLVQKGVQKNRLHPVGFGYAANKAPNDTEAGRALNRRVEIALQRR
jgi:outer membrane protein OmpA-like peptidoglycan-associated protein